MATDQVPWLSHDEEAAWRAFRRLLTVVPARIGRDLGRDSNLSAADYEVLSTLSERPDGSWALRDLAAKAEWSRSRMSHQASRMQQRGLVEKSPDPDDARGCLLRLTAAGYRELVAAAPDHVVSVRRRFLDHLTPAELTTLRRISERVADLDDVP